VELRRDGESLRCSAPEGTLTPELVSGIRAYKPELLRLLDRPTDSAPQRTLSFVQERFWFLAQLEPENPAYNVPFAARIRGSLAVRALESAVAGVVDRHEVLRTNYPGLNGKPVARVFPPGTWRMGFGDLGGLSGTERAEAVRRYAADEETRPFDLAAGPLIRATLLRLGADEHVLLVTAAHVVFDLWSWRVFFDEVAAGYAAGLGSGRPPAPPPLQYSEHVRAEADAAATGAYSTQLAFWRVALGRDHMPSEVPTDFRRPPVRGHRGAEVRGHVSGAAAAFARYFCRRNRTTPFVFYLSAFLALLARLTGRARVTVGTPSSARSRPEFEALIGPFLNTLVVAAEAEPGIDFCNFARSVGRTVFEALDNRDVPFEQVVEAVAPARDLSREPLFQVAFVFQHQNLRSLELAGLEVQELEHETNSAKFDLSLTVTESDSGFGLRLEYAADLYIAETADMILILYTRILDRLAVAPASLLADLPGPDAAGPAPIPPRMPIVPRDETLGEFFRSAARRRPDTVAVADPEGYTTYGALDYASDRLAGVLAGHGVRDETPVGICLPPGVGYVTAVLAIVKAGGVYVPLDPRDYHGLNAAEAARLSLVVGDPRFAGEYRPSASWVGLDGRSVGGSGRPGVASRVRADNLACLIPSDGRMVGVTHSAVISWCRDGRVLVTGEGDATPLLAGPSDPVGVIELWSPLLAGARLEVPPVGLSVGGVDDFLRDRGLTAAWLSAGVASQGRYGLHRVVIGRSFSEPGRMLDPTGKGELVVAAGSPETSPASFVERPAAADAARAQMPLGRPNAGVTGLVLSAGGTVAPAGIVGELFIGGQGLARGYYSRPVDTAAVFLPNPYPGCTGERAFATGCPAKYLPDGRLDSIIELPEDGRTCAFRPAGVSPRTATEEALAELWGELLRTRKIGVHDDFFELGGHSLLATQMVARVDQLFGVRLPVRAVFECPTVAEMAEQVEQIKASEPPTDSVLEYEEGEI
jgi:non-ribosomal peptide synthetase component F